MGHGPSVDPNEQATALFAGLPHRYDLLVEALSLGQNSRWRRAMLDRIGIGLDPASTKHTLPRMLDVASGTATVASSLAERFGAAVVGADLSLEMLKRGLCNLERSNANNSSKVANGFVTLAGGRAEQLPFPDRCFDALTFTYLLRYVGDVDATLAELARVVRPGAPMASLDFLAPSSSFWRGCWWGYTRLILPVAGLVSGGRSWWRVGRFLGPNISGHYFDHPVEALIASWQRAGFEDVGARAMSLGGGLVMWGRRSGG